MTTEINTQSNPTPPKNPPRPSLFLMAFVIVPLALLFALFLGVIRDALRPAPSLLAPTVPIDLTPGTYYYPAPEFGLQNAEGETVLLSDYRGRIVFLNFWQTWCGPCIREMPAFRAFIDEQPDAGPTVLTVNIAETREAVAAFFQRNGLPTVPVLFDTTSLVRLDYGVTDLPMTFVIDGDGMVRRRLLGEMTMERMYEFVAEIEASDGQESTAG